MASLTSCTALSVGIDMLNSTSVVEAPSSTVDITFLTPLIPATASSISLVIWVSISAGAAPDWVTVIATSGTSIFGKRVIGRAMNDCQPSTMTIKNPSSGAIGLRIDQAEKFIIRLP